MLWALFARLQCLFRVLELIYKEHCLQILGIPCFLRVIVSRLLSVFFLLLLCKVSPTWHFRFVLLPFLEILPDYPAMEIVLTNHLFSSPCVQNWSLPGYNLATKEVATPPQLLITSSSRRVWMVDMSSQLVKKKQVFH